MQTLPAPNNNAGREPKVLILMTLVAYANDPAGDDTALTISEG